MNQLQKFTIGLGAAFGVPLLFLIIVPWMHMRDLNAIPYSEADTETEAPAYPPGKSGRTQAGYGVYAAEGCTYCHTQMVRPTYAGSDMWRPGWGGREEDGLNREPRPRDYLGEGYAFLGVHRNGPDLSNVGWRRPDAAWHHRHLYNPRAVTDWSIMPSYNHLYRVQRIEDAPAEDALALTGEHAPPAGYEVVPTAKAKALVDYILSLKKDYKLPVVLTGESAESAAGGGSGT